mmetsp:Transcript_7023/g.17347  ORF Transcript_7023/g.17347 Transcript_7023/m.17347 type:complete len:212 (-) Transcript_7023:992-1627(-)
MHDAPLVLDQAEVVQRGRRGQGGLGLQTPRGRRSWARRRPQSRLALLMALPTSSLDGYNAGDLRSLQQPQPPRDFLDKIVQHRRGLRHQRRSALPLGICLLLGCFQLFKLLPRLLKLGHQNSQEQIEDNALPNDHQRNEIEARPEGRRAHPIVHDCIPVLPTQNLKHRDEGPKQAIEMRPRHLTQFRVARAIHLLVSSQIKTHFEREHLLT